MEGHMYVSRCFAMFSVLALVPACGAMDAGDPLSEAATGDNEMHGAAEPHMFHGKGEARPSHGGGGSSPNMTLHGGNVLASNTTHLIWWGSQWTNATFAGDKISGMTTFFQGFGGSNYAGTSTEYAGADKQQVTAASSFVDSVIDSTAAPSKALTVSGAVAEACKSAANNPDPNGVYFIYTATGAGHVSYC